MLGASHVMVALVYDVVYCCVDYDISPEPVA